MLRKNKVLIDEIFAVLAERKVELLGPAELRAYFNTLNRKQLERRLLWARTKSIAPRACQGTQGLITVKSGCFQ